MEAQGWELSKYCKRINMFKISRNIACAFGDDHGGGYDFILWGNSHARHFLPGISTLAKDRKLSGMLFSRAGCHPFLGDPHTTKECRDFNAAVARRASDRQIKFAILGGRWMLQTRHLRQYTGEEDPSANAGGLAKTLAFLNDKGIVVSVLDQVPDFPLEIRSCVERNVYFGRDFKTCATPPAAPFVLRHRVLTDYFGFLQKHYSFYVASTARLFCNSEVCRAYDGETLLMQDTHHLTEAGALRSIPYLKIPPLAGPSEEHNATVAGTAPASAASSPEGL